MITTKCNNSHIKPIRLSDNFHQTQEGTTIKLTGVGSESLVHFRKRSDKIFHFQSGFL